MEKCSLWSAPSLPVDTKNWSLFLWSTQNESDKLKKALRIPKDIKAESINQKLVSVGLNYLKYSEEIIWVLLFLLGLGWSKSECDPNRQLRCSGTEKLVTKNAIFFSLTVVEQVITIMNIITITTFMCKSGIIFTK